jgi:hypothetical protein
MNYASGELWRWSGEELARAIRTKKISSREAGITLLRQTVLMLPILEKPELSFWVVVTPLLSLIVGSLITIYTDEPLIPGIPPGHRAVQVAEHPQPLPPG